jgi:hypothetical protein
VVVTDAHSGPGEPGEIAVELAALVSPQIRTLTPRLAAAMSASSIVVSPISSL